MQLVHVHHCWQRLLLKRRGALAWAAAQCGAMQRASQMCDQWRQGCRLHAPRVAADAAAAHQGATQAAAAAGVARPAAAAAALHASSAATNITAAARIALWLRALGCRCVVGEMRRVRWEMAEVLRVGAFHSSKRGSGLRRRRMLAMEGERRAAWGCEGCHTSLQRTHTATPRNTASRQPSCLKSHLRSHTRRFHRVACTAHARMRTALHAHRGMHASSCWGDNGMRCSPLHISQQFEVVRQAAVNERWGTRAMPVPKASLSD